MDEINDQPQVVYTAPTPWYQRKILWVFALMLILILVGTYVYTNYFMKSSSPKVQMPAQITEKTIKESELPVGVAILKNPMVYEWRGSVEGTLTAKDDKSITISDNNGNKITIIVQNNSKEITGGTRFFKNKLAKDPKSNLINLKDIPLGTKLLGDFFVFPHNKNELVGSSFVVVEP